MGHGSRNSKKVVDPSSWKDSSKFLSRDKKDASDPDFTRRNNNNVLITGNMTAIIAPSSGNGNSNYSPSQPQSQHVPPPPPLTFNNTMNINVNNPPPMNMNNYNPYLEPNGMMPMYAPAPTPYAPTSYLPNMYPVAPQQLAMPPANSMQQPQWITPVTPINHAYYHGNAPIPMSVPMYAGQPDFYANGGNYMSNQYQPPQNQGYQQSNQSHYANNNNNNNSNNNKNSQPRGYNHQHEFPPLGNS
jgi:hypothetical protein